MVEVEQVESCISLLEFDEDTNSPARFGSVQDEQRRDLVSSALTFSVVVILVDLFLVIVEESTCSYRLMLVRDCQRPRISRSSFTFIQSNRFEILT